jgi:hypothetical protein
MHPTISESRYFQLIQVLYLLLELFQTSNRGYDEESSELAKSREVVRKTIYLPESGTGRQPVPGLYNYFTIGYTRNEPDRFAQARYHPCTELIGE